MKFRHLLITNFQYPAEFAFLDERLELFNKLTIPSVKNQTYKNFTWIIIVNTITESITVPKDLGMKVKITSNEKFQNFLSNLKTDYVVTTRLNNCDMVHPKFIEEIQKVAKPNPCNYLIDINFLKYELSTGNLFKSKVSDKVSPFVSLVEPIKEDKIPTTIHRRAYKGLSRTRDIEKIKKDKAVQTIHDYIDPVSDNPYEEIVEILGKKINQKGIFFNKYIKDLK